MPCRLCLQDKPLIKKSHILPTFLYAPLKDAGNSMVAVKSGSSLGRTTQTGEFEGGLLCADCDNRIIGGYESYASRLISTTEPVPGIVVVIFRAESGEEKFAQLKGIDYRAFKLFLHSLVWRASISSRPFFRHVALASDVEERLRVQLLTGKPGPSIELPCVIHIPRNSQLLWGVTREPVPTDHGYQFLIAGAYYDFYTKSEQSAIAVASSIKEDGSMKLILLPSSVVQRLEDQILERFPESGTSNGQY